MNTLDKLFDGANINRFCVISSYRRWTVEEIIKWLKEHDSETEIKIDIKHTLLYRILKEEFKDI